MKFLKGFQKFQVNFIDLFSITVLDENDSPPEVQVPSECIQITEFHNM